MDRVRLSEKLADAEPSSGSDRIIWVDDLTGSGLRIRPGGTKIFVAQ